MTSSITKFKTGHEDLVHGIEYDYYGKRLVSCSADHRLKVWDYVEGGNSVWELNDTWKGHDGSVIKATWAPPEYGQIIASGSFDRTVKIWEEQPGETKNSQRRWSERFRLLELKGVVMDIAFSPVPGALRLALCSVDGMVRIYECLEPTNLMQWSQVEEFAIDMGQDSTSSSLESPPPRMPTSSLLSQQQLLQQHQLQEQQQLYQLQQQQQQQQDHETRRQSSSSTKDDTSNQDSPPPVSGTRSQPPHLALGSPPTAATILQQYQQQQQQHLSLKTPGSNSSGASSTMENSQLPFGTYVPSTPGFPPPLSPKTLPEVTAGLAISSSTHPQQQQQPQSGFCIDWCPNRTATPMMVVGLGKEHGAKIFKHDGHSRWQPGELLFGHTNQVNDVSWAPSMGRTYQLIATACKDHYVRIFKLTSANKIPGTRVNMLSKPTSSQPTGAYQIEMVAALDQHQAEVWRVEWNIMGTILSSSDRNGSLRLWTVGNDGEWVEMTSISISNQQK